MSAIWPRALTQHIRNAPLHLGYIQPRIYVASQYRTRRPADGIERQARSCLAAIAPHLEPAQTAVEALTDRWRGLRRPAITFHADRPGVGLGAIGLLGSLAGTPSRDDTLRPESAAKFPPSCLLSTPLIQHRANLLGSTRAARTRPNAPRESGGHYGRNGHRHDRPDRSDRCRLCSHFCGKRQARKAKADTAPTENYSQGCCHKKATIGVLPSHA
jgi:hypothetical protein